MASSATAKRTTKRKSAMKAQKLCWAPGSHIKIDAELAIPRLNEIAKKYGGVDKKEAWEEAKHDPVLGPHFSDKNAAALKWWHEEARYLFRSAGYQDADGDFHRIFYSVVLPEHDVEDPPVYMNLDQVRANEDAKNWVLDQAMRQLQWLKMRREALISLLGAQLFEAVDTALGRLERTNHKPD